MTKTASTAITAAILVSGGGALYLIHRDNQAAAARVEAMGKPTQIRVDVPVFPTNSDAKPSHDDTTPVQTPAEMLTRWRDLFTGEGSTNHEEKSRELMDFHQKLESMDPSEFQEIAKEAERMGDLPNMLVSFFIHSFTQKSPEGAAVHGARLAAIAPEYDLMVVSSVSNAFEQWLHKAPEAAGAWYEEAAANGTLVQKTMPPEGKESFALHRNLSRVRFTALLESSPQEAEAMIPSMLPDDLVIAVDAARKLGKMNEEEAAGWIRKVQAANSSGE